MFVVLVLYNSLLYVLYLYNVKEKNYLLFYMCLK